MEFCAAFPEQLPDRFQVVLERTLEVAPAERLSSGDQRGQIATGAVGLEDRRGSAVIYARLGERRVVRALAQLQVLDQLVDDLRLLGELLLARPLGLVDRLQRLVGGERAYRTGEVQGLSQGPRPLLGRAGDEMGLGPEVGQRVRE